MARLTRRTLLGAALSVPACAHLGAGDDAPPSTPRSWAWVGGVTSQSAEIRALFRGASDPYLWVSPRLSPGSAQIIRPVRVGPSGVAAFRIAGLRPHVEHLYAVRDRGRTDEIRGRFWTFPTGPASFSFCTASCARTGSNHRVFEEIQARDPLFFLHLGDLHYENIAAADPAAFGRAFRRVLSSPRQSALYGSRATAYVWDDHDYGPNNSDRTSPSRGAALRAYREHVPHYPLLSGGALRTIHQAFDVGRVRFLLSDLRADRDPPGPGASMLGAAQKAWLKDELRGAGRYALVVWASSVGWLGNRPDKWGGGYAEERDEIAEVIREARVDNLLVVSGDAHALAIDDGSNNAWGGFPVFHCAALDQRGSDKGGTYSHPMVPGRGQFGEVRIEDDGEGPAQVTLTGRDADGAVLMQHRFTAGAPPRPISAPGSDPASRPRPR